jgi:hypothetical protein
MIIVMVVMMIVMVIAMPMNNYRVPIMIVYDRCSATAANVYTEAELRVCIPEGSPGVVRRPGIACDHIYRGCCIVKADTWATPVAMPAPVLMVTPLSTIGSKHYSISAGAASDYRA